MPSLSPRTALLLILASLALVSPASIHTWQWQEGGLQPALFPAGAQALRMRASIDLDGDGLPETLSLKDGRAAILSASRVRWQSPPAWQVRQALFADLNHDGRTDAVLLVWRPFQPWPVDAWLPSGGRIENFHDAAGMSCQIILIGWRGSEYGELWAGSALAEPVRSFAVADLNGDNIQELVTLEGRYADSRSAPASALKVWDWNGFGFTVLSSLPGTFYEMALVQAADGRYLILSQ